MMVKQQSFQIITRSSTNVDRTVWSATVSVDAFLSSTEKEDDTIPLTTLSTLVPSDDTTTVVLEPTTGLPELDPTTDVGSNILSGVFMGGVLAV